MKTKYKSVFKFARESCLIINTATLQNLVNLRKDDSLTKAASGLLPT
jgi:hypothetical protein